MQGQMMERIKQSTVVKEILHSIKKMLLNNVLKPGERLPSEQEMAAQFGVGKSSVREAIKMLDAAGVVESRQGAGTFICETPKEDSLNPLIFQFILLQGSDRQLLEFRKMFETAYTFMAMNYMTGDDMKRIESLLKPTNRAEQDGEFHRAILNSTHNPYIIRIGEILIDLFEIKLDKTLQTYDPKEKINREHQIIFDALRKKDSVVLQEILDESYELYEKYFLNKG